MNFQNSPIYFMGRGPFSKSLFLRALIVKSYFSSFQIKGPDDKKVGEEELSSHCGEDVQYAQQALKQLHTWKNHNLLSGHNIPSNKTNPPQQDTSQNLIMDCGLSGAVLRFLSLRVARESSLLTHRGFLLKGEKHLFKRPMKELISILRQLSCEVELKPQCLYINPTGSNKVGIKSDEGWRPKGDSITVSISRSSQFASALLLNSWLLPFDLYMSLEGKPVSFSYLKMTISLLRSLGMNIISQEGSQNENWTRDTIKLEQKNTLALCPPLCGHGREYYIPAGQKPNKWFYELEVDMDCLFALSAMTVGGGEVIFTDWPEQSLQPNFIFPMLLKKMGFNVYSSAGLLKVSKGQVIHPITANLRECPDLFPVLSALLALSEGESHLFGAPHLKNKESHRIKKTAELLEKVGKTVRVLDDGLIISGPLPHKKCRPFAFDPAGDHRMAMSACVLKKAGLPVRVLTPEVVNKSFLKFWSIVLGSESP